MPESDEKPLVVIRSLVYNHEPYLRDCLEGFVMQQTTFPFVAVVHDDCSTDGSAAIIREYAEKYPHIIKPVFETENQYSKHDGSLRRAMDEACGKYGAKYYALCEGDDYWTDPHKLQKQVDFMDSHPDYTMVCSDAVVRTPEKDLTEDDFRRMGWYRYHESRDMAVEDIIEKGGWFIHTATIVFRQDLRNNYPEACHKAPIGDYPLQIFAALTGKVFYFNEKMAAYRWRHATSWSVRQDKLKSATAHANLRAEINMLQSLDEYSNFTFADSFIQSCSDAAIRFLHSHPQEKDAIVKEYKDYLLRKNIPIRANKRPKSLIAKIQDIWEQVCYHPYYPRRECPCLLRHWASTFYMVSPTKSTFHIGHLHVASFVRDGEKCHLYVCGLRLT